MNSARNKSPFVLGTLLLAAVGAVVEDADAQRRRFPRRRPTPRPTRPAVKKEKDKGPQPKPVALVDVTVHTGRGEIIPRATILMQGTRIKEIGAKVLVPENAKIVQGGGRHACPGVVAMGLGGIGVGRGGRSYRDGLNPYDSRIKWALAAGITSSIEGRGSRNCVVKMTWGTLDGMFLAEGTRVSMSGFSARSAKNNTALAETFLEWRAAYQDWLAKVAGGDKTAKEPKADRKIASLVKVYKGQAVLWIESLRNAESIRFAVDFLERVELPSVMNNPTEGWILAPEMGRARCMAIVAPRTFRPRNKMRMDPNGTTIEIAALLSNAGVPVACFPARSRFGGGGIGRSGLLGRDMHTPFAEPAFAVRGGLSRAEALASVTRIPARMAGVGHRVGTLEKGKDADILLMTGEPLHYQSLVDYAYINGKLYYDRTKEPLLKDVPTRKPGPK